MQRGEGGWCEGALHLDVRWHYQHVLVIAVVSYRGDNHRVHKAVLEGRGGGGWVLAQGKQNGKEQRNQTGTQTKEGLHKAEE